MKKAFTLIELLIVVAIIAILAAIAVPNFLEAQTRAKVARAQTDMRSMATGIEAFYIDNNQYPFHTATSRPAATTGVPAITPAATADQHFNGNTPNGLASPNRTQILATPTFLVSHRNPAGSGPLTAGITTPVSFLTTLFPDNFADAKGSTFNYYSNGPGWILWTPGPDVDQATQTDMGAPASAGSPGSDYNNYGVIGVETVYNTGVSQPSQGLLASGTNTLGATYTYDPTNGTTSNGDVYRVKQ